MVSGLATSFLAIWGTNFPRFLLERSIHISCSGEMKLVLANITFYE